MMPVKRMQIAGDAMEKNITKQYDKDKDKTQTQYDKDCDNKDYPRYGETISHYDMTNTNTKQHKTKKTSLRKRRHPR